MSYYAPYPGFYPYPMGYPGQEYYAMYPPDQMDPNDPIFYDGSNLSNVNNYMPNNNFRPDKVGYNNRKESNDSGISDASSRKVSSVSTISNVSSCIAEDLEDVDEDKPFEIPDDELCIQISQQVEFYFSDANICKDKFLLKHVKRNKEGFVSLKLISSFKRLKHLTKDWRQVGYAVEKMSKRLEVNDQKTKVRRMDSLPEHDETALSRTVLVLNLPMERPTIESVAEIFSICGDVALIRILRPGNPLPADVRPFASKNPDLTSKVCALIEFERTEYALRARKLLNSEEDDQLKVMELVAPVPSKAAKKAEERKKFAAAKQQQQQIQQQQHMQQQQQQRRYSQGAGNNNNQNQAAPMPRRKIGVFGNPKFSPIVEEQNMRAEGLNPNSHSYPQPQRKNSRSNLQQAGSGANGSNSNDAAGISAWMTRRISGGQLEFARSGLTLPPNVIRQPRGPEEGKGFQRWVKNRMEPVAASAAAAKASEAATIVEKTAASKEITEKEKTNESQELADSCEAAISRLTVAPVILTHSEESCSSDDDDESNKESEKSR